MNRFEPASLAGRRLIVVGAGDLGREIHAWFPEVKIHGFLDSRRAEWDYPGLAPIVGDPESYTPRRDEVFLCAIANTQAKLAVAEQLRERGAEFITLVHPTAQIAPEVRIGKGCVIFPSAILDVNSEIGDHVVLYFRSGVGHDTRMEDGCVVLTNAVVGAHCVIERGTTVSTLAFCNSGIHVGAFALIGAGSFAARDVPAGATALGVPARNIFGQSKTTVKPAPPDAVEAIEPVVC